MQFTFKLTPDFACVQGRVMMNLMPQCSTITLKMLGEQIQNTLRASLLKLAQVMNHLSCVHLIRDK